MKAGSSIFDGCLLEYNTKLSHSLADDDTPVYVQKLCCINILTLRVAQFARNKPGSTTCHDRNKGPDIQSSSLLNSSVTKVDSPSETEWKHKKGLLFVNDRKLCCPLSETILASDGIVS